MVISLQENNTLTIFNPAPARADLPNDIFQACDIIAPNEPEAELLTGEKVDSSEGAVRAARKLIDKGCKTVIMTRPRQATSPLAGELSRSLPIVGVNHQPTSDSIMGNASRSGGLDLGCPKRS